MKTCFNILLIAITLIFINCTNNKKDSDTILNSEKESNNITTTEKLKYNNSKIKKLIVKKN